MRPQDPKKEPDVLKDTEIVADQVWDFPSFLISQWDVFTKILIFVSFLCDQHSGKELERHLVYILLSHTNLESYMNTNPIKKTEKGMPKFHSVILEFKILFLRVCIHFIVYGTLTMCQALCYVLQILST